MHRRRRAAKSHAAVQFRLHRTHGHPACPDVTDNATTQLASPGNQWSNSTCVRVVVAIPPASIPTNPRLYGMHSRGLLTPPETPAATNRSTSLKPLLRDHVRHYSHPGHYSLSDARRPFRARHLSTPVYRLRRVLVHVPRNEKPARRRMIGPYLSRLPVNRRRQECNRQLE
jgi:hypothetical protein